MAERAGKGYERALAVAMAVAREAGELLRADFHREGGPRAINPAHAVADEEAEALIRSCLREAFPDWGYRGEETRPDVLPSGRPGRIWLVDPNDGTSGYLRGRRGSAVSIGLLSDRQPVLGVVFAFAAPDDDGDFFAWAQGCGPLTRNGQKVGPPSWPAQVGRHDAVFLSRGAERVAEVNARIVAPARFFSMPSIAYRLALVAAGEGVAAVSLNPAGDWDYAAGHALLRGGDGVLLNEHAEDVVYNAAGQSRVGHCVGGAPGIAHRLTLASWDGAIDRGQVPPDDLLGPVRPVLGQSISDARKLARAQGCLLGQFAGDALGSQVEFQSGSATQAAYPGGLRELADGGSWDTLAGQPTDDSELALMLARSIVFGPDCDPENAAALYSHWYRSTPFDIGGTIGHALQAIHPEDIRDRRAVAAAGRAANPQSQANGSLMRISPLGIWGAGRSTDDIATAARADSALTHPHVACQEACAVFCLAIATAIETGAEPLATYRAARDWTTHHATSDAVRTAIRDAERKPPDDYATRQGWVVIALQNAFYQLLHAENLTEGVVSTVMAGGDTDTNAAIAGALLGAVHGRAAVPEQWRRLVLTCRAFAGFDNVLRPRPREFWPVELYEIAERLMFSSPRNRGRTGD